LNKKKKIFIVAMTDSIHTVRWINQINNQGWDIYIFPSYDNPKFHYELKSVIFLVPFYNLSNNLSQIGFGNILYILKYFNRKFNKDYYIKRLSKYILKLKPDLIHTLETQGAGYLTAKALKLNNISIPWWHTNWGSDIYLFGRLVDHQIQIREVLEKCNFYSCECERDVALALNLGFNGHVFPVYPNTGGFDLALLSEIKKDSLLTSNRRIIMLKGYQGWAGRALVGIRSLARCSDILKGYKIVIYANTDSVDIQIAAALLSQSINIPVILLPNNTSHKEILTYHSKARISIGLSISDAISTSLLETMAMGSFPIQSCTACATEWIVNNVSGFIVPPEDPDIIESMIRKALSDDDLVNNAAKINFETITNKAEYNKLKELTIQSYKNILSEN
jgi:hypothetical protein